MKVPSKFLQLNTYNRGYKRIAVSKGRRRYFHIQINDHNVALAKIQTQLDGETEIEIILEADNEPTLIFIPILDESLQDDQVVNK